MEINCADSRELIRKGVCAVERFGNDIFVIGFSNEMHILRTTMERYDVTTNELTTLTRDGRL